MKHFLFSFALCSFLFLQFDLKASDALDSLKIHDYLKENNIKAESTTDGVYYKIAKKGNGDQPKSGDYVMVNYKGMLVNGKTFDESKEGEPLVFQLGHRQVIRGWESGIPKFKVGSAGQLFVPASMAYGKTGAGKAIPPNSDLIFEIEVLKVMTFQEYDSYMFELEKKQRQKFIEQKKEQLKIDKKLIQDFAISKKIKSKRTNSGLSYAITKKGKGEKAKAGDVLKVSYTGYLLDGSVFDKSKKGFEFPLGKNKVIKGWEEGLTYFNKGSEGWLMIPSQFAYGPRSIEEDDISIPSNSVLVFKIKVEDITK